MFKLQSGDKFKYGKKLISLSFLFIFLPTIITEVDAYTFSTEPWTQADWGTVSRSTQETEVKTWVETNWIKRDEFVETPWEDVTWDAKTREEQVNDQKRFQYLSWRVHKDLPITFSTRNKKVININESKFYFVPKKTVTEWDRFTASVDAGNLPDLSLANAGCTYDSQDYDVDQVWTTSTACIYTTTYTYACNYQCDTCSVQDYIACSINCSYSEAFRCSSGCGATHCNLGGDCRDWWVYKDVSCNCSYRSTCTGTNNNNGTIITTHTCNADGSVTDSVGTCG